ncbi:MAG: CDF family Co(II)/Ni(II) efflux transporter DmeF [Coriobacteriia bacterium]
MHDQHRSRAEEALERTTRHDHTFGQDLRRPGEPRTRVVIALTAVTMVVEIVAGTAFGSMALLADGLHMASHTTALAITAVAYAYARRNAGNRHYSFGTGKVNALAGFTGAVLLAIFAAIMAWESFGRVMNPVEIAFDQAIWVAVLGLAVNGISVVILGVDEHPHDHESAAAGHHHDHNLRSAYLHVLADALTSVLAIGALLAAKYFGVVWVDPAVGLLGAALVTRWSWGLLKETGGVLLDRQASKATLETLTAAVEGDDSVVTDLHVWSIGPSVYAGILGVEGPSHLDAADYRARVPRTLGLAHLSIEVAHPGAPTRETNEPPAV